MLVVLVAPVARVVTVARAAKVARVVLVVPVALVAPVVQVAQPTRMRVYPPGLLTLCPMQGFRPKLMRAQMTRCAKSFLSRRLEHVRRIRAVI